MLTLPFPLEIFPADQADAALDRLRQARANIVPVLLGDADIFSTEWAESVDAFEPPEAVLAEARELDPDAWFTSHRVPDPAPRRRSALGRAARVASRILTPRRAANSQDMARLREQLAELEALGDDWSEARETIAALEADGVSVFPDPIAYVTPRDCATLAAGLVAVGEPWEAVAWLQHGTYALCAPKPILAAHCRWLWQRHGARIITASTDHIGFELDRPIALAADARETLARFLALGATEVNADRHGSDGSSLIGARRLWVWWD